ncbi:hypothetical protein ABLN85_04340 [Mycobacterium tuberculosis]
MKRFRVFVRRFTPGTAITNDIGHLRTASGQTDVSRVYCHSGSAVAVFA